MAAKTKNEPTGKASVSFTQVHPIRESEIQTPVTEQEEGEDITETLIKYYFKSEERRVAHFISSIAFHTAAVFIII